MATSGETSFSRTAGEWIKSAMVELGAISMGDESELSEYQEAVVRLNGLLKFLDVKRAMYRDSSGTLTITGGVGAASLPSDVREVSSLRHIVSATNHRQLVQWNRAQYYALPNRFSAGNPTIYFVNKTTGGNEIRLWPVPSTDVDLHMDYSRAVEVVTAPDETLDIPEDWQNAVMLNLAARLASMFGTDRIDLAKVQRIEQSAAFELQTLLDADRPDSYYFEPWGAYA